MENAVKIEIDGAHLDDIDGETMLCLFATGQGEKYITRITVQSADAKKQQNGQEALKELLSSLGLDAVTEPDDLVFRDISLDDWNRVAFMAERCDPKPRPTPAPPPRVERTARPQKEDGRFVYVISCEGSDPPLCKIGIAGSPEKRVGQLSTSSPHPLRLEMARYSDRARAVEAAAHSHFSHARRNGEWFEICATEAISFVNGEITQMRKAA